MTLCYQNNISCCYYPAHTSHGLQPLDNGPYNALKSFYRSHLARLAHLTDSAPVDKINFIRCYAAARVEGLTKKNIQSGFRVTGNWPINRYKALAHPEIHPDKENRTVRPGTPESDQEAQTLPNTPTTARQIKDMGKNEAPDVRRRFQKAAEAFDKKVMECRLKEERIQQLEAQLERAQPKRRKKIPNPNRAFMTLAEILASGGVPTAEAVNEIPAEEQGVIIDLVDGEQEDQDQAGEAVKEEYQEPIHTRSGRAIVRPSRYND